jgi:predicted nucleic acid-binding protein
MKSYLLDTSIIISYLQGKTDVVKLLNDIDGELTSSYICLAELYEGVYRVKNKLEIEKSVTDFFKSLSELYTIDEKVAKQFGEIRAKLKIGGNVIEDIDIFIAATCLVYDLTLLTHNVRHFSRINNLKILNAAR